MFPQGDGAAPLPGWWPEAMLWLGVGLGLAATAAAAGAWTVAARIAALREEARALDALQEIQRVLQRLLAAHGELDLRRVEHLLIDLRDGSRRAEEALLRLHESRSPESEALVPALSPGLGERVVNRLLALGYERIELVTPAEELERLARSDGQLLVEARREGVLCKGKVVIRAGRIDGVHLASAFPVFP